MNKNIACLMCILLILAVLAFIWGNSMQSVAESKALSLSVLDKVKPVLELFVGTGNVTDRLVRKLAHFIGFGALGCGLALLLIFRGRVRPRNVANCAFAGLVAALIDETIQIFSNRGPQVQDIWIDFGGVCAGLFLTLTGYLVIKVVWNKRNKSRRLRPYFYSWPTFRL